MNLHVLSIPYKKSEFAYNVQAKHGTLAHSFLRFPSVQPTAFPPKKDHIASPCAAFNHAQRCNSLRLAGMQIRTPVEVAMKDNCKEVNIESMILRGKKRSEATHPAKPTPRATQAEHVKGLLQ